MAEGELQKVVGANLRLFRQGKGWSQEEFAHQLGVHRTYMGSLERGERNLSLRSVERLADALAVGPLELLTDPEEAQPA